METFGSDIQELEIKEYGLVRARDCKNVGRDGLIFGKKLEIVSLYGKVVCCEAVGKTDDKLAFFLHDGKSDIRCMTSRLQDNPKLLDEVNLNWNRINDISDKSQDEMAAFQLISATKKLYMKNIANTEKLKYGNIVRVWGKMRTYRGENYVYVTNIQVISTPEDKIYYQKSYEIVSGALDQYENYLNQQTNEIVTDSQ